MSKSVQKHSAHTNVPPTDLLDPACYVPLCVGNTMIGIVSPILLEGYHAARKVYAEMEETAEEGPYFFLTGYEYAHLARRHMPAHLQRIERHEWQRGFIVGWNACNLHL